MSLREENYRRVSSVYESPYQNKKRSSVRGESFRQSVRKPIFEKKMYYTSNKDKDFKRPLSVYNSVHIQSSINDDFCGCEHNLQPCNIISQLLAGLNASDMRRQYEKIQSLSTKKSKFQLRRKYFRHLPNYYPQIYHAQLANILMNIEEELTFNQFITLAWIQYHSKLQHITYFLFTDLKNAQKSMKKFFLNLESSLIRYEVNFTYLVQQSKKLRIPLIEFLQDYYETIGANVIPLSQYGKFIRLLLKNGFTILIRLVIIFLTSKKETLFNLLKSTSSGSNLRQRSRQLSWELFLQELSNKN